MKRLTKEVEKGGDIGKKRRVGNERDKEGLATKKGGYNNGKKERVR